MREIGFYDKLSGGTGAKIREHERGKKLDLGRTLQRLRERAGLTGAELCRRSGGFDPRTLNAIEKGRIRNPSLENLQALSEGLGCLVRDLFTSAEMEVERNYHQGSAKGAFHIEFPKTGVRVLSLTPPNSHFFCGRLFLGPKRKVEGALLKRNSPVFFEVIMGRVEFMVEDKLVSLKEGENLFFDGRLRHSFRNALNREAVLWFVFLPADKYNSLR